jgi:hypothetical protein
MTMAQIKDFIAREYTQADASVQAFIAWLEGKDAALQAAKTLLEANGFTVTPKA